MTIASKLAYLWLFSYGCWSIISVCSVLSQGVIYLISTKNVIHNALYCRSAPTKVIWSPAWYIFTLTLYLCPAPFNKLWLIAMRRLFLTNSRVFKALLHVVYTVPNLMIFRHQLMDFEDEKMVPRISPSGMLIYIPNTTQFCIPNSK